MDTLFFNTEEFNYWPIYDTIKKYYPIGIPFNDNTYEFYRNYSGSKELWNLVLDNIHNDNHYQERWVAFQKYIENKFGKEVVGTTLAQAPSFSSYIILEQQEQKGILYSKELHFSISLLGPYYSIYGLDTTTVFLNLESLYNKTEDNPGMYVAINAITASPFLEYEEPFLKLERIINDKYPDYRLIPYTIHSNIINGLQLGHSNKEICTIFNAIFHDNHDFDRIQTRGDDYYGYDNWRTQNHYS